MATCSSWLLYTHYKYRTLPSSQKVPLDSTGLEPGPPALPWHSLLCSRSLLISPPTGPLPPSHTLAHSRAEQTLTPPEGDSPALPPTAGPPRASMPAAPLTPGQVQAITCGHSFGQQTFQTPTLRVSGADDPGERRTLTLLRVSPPSPAERAGVGTEPTTSQSPRARRAVHVSPKSPPPGPKTRRILQASSGAEPRTTG